MTSSIPIEAPMRELEAANEYLGDRERLDKFWDEHGYLFFRRVFDPELVRPFREAMVSVLEEHGFIKPNGKVPTWTGKGFEEFGTKPAAIYDLRLAERFFKLPEVRELFEHVLGEPSRFIPIVEYRFTPPAAAAGAATFTGAPHQDGFGNDGIPFRICWVPLMTIDEALGGIAVAPDLHKGGYLHDLMQPPMFPIPPGAISDDAWHRTTYRAGDILIMNRATPHGGLPNRSDRMRLTMDFRIAGESEALPAVGEVVAVTPDGITVSLGDGSRVALSVDDETYVRPRSRGGARISRAELQTTFPLGAPVMVSHERGKALVIRTPIEHS